MSGWQLVRMESLTWLNLLIAGILIGGAFLFDLPAWTFWTAIVVGSVVVVLEIFDEWAEQRGLAAEVVGPESVVLLAGLWLVGTVLVTGGPAAFVAIAVVGGGLIATSSLINTIAAFRMDPTSGSDGRED